MKKKEKVLSNIKNASTSLYNSEDSGSAYNSEQLGVISYNLNKAKSLDVNAKELNEALFGTFPKKHSDTKVSSIETKEIQLAHGTTIPNEIETTESSNSYIKKQEKVVEGFLDGRKTLANVMNSVYNLNSSITTGKRSDNYWQKQIGKVDRNPQDSNNSVSSEAPPPSSSELEKSKNESWEKMVTRIKSLTTLNTVKAF